jgi:hypothetical protein
MFEARFHSLLCQPKGRTLDGNTQGQPEEAVSDDIEQVLTSLEATPRRVAAVSLGIDDERLSFKPDETTWSANEILAHLRANADVWGKSILAMITQDHPTIRYVSPRGWMRKASYHSQGFHESLQTFIQQRTELLTTLKALKCADWSRRATFTGTTSGREQTILSYARRIADHEHEYLEQLEVLLKQEIR